jgi:hypothetical protein
MARMVDLIRDGSAPESILRRAAQGRLSVPVEEAIEILVSLSVHRELGEQAVQTLGCWDEASLADVASSPTLAVEVLTHLLQHQAHRPLLLLALCENPALPLTELEALARQARCEVLRVMMQSARVHSSSRLLDLMAANSAAEPMKAHLTVGMARALDGEAEKVASDFLVRHAEDLAQEGGQPFELVAGPAGEEDPLDKLLTHAKEGGTTAATPEDTAKLSLLQRIGRLQVGERIKLAVRGNREERMVLIRDRSKLVSLAVLESPKVNDAEMENFAAMKNIQESVLRAMASKRNYIKNYGVLRTLVNNPKTPIDVALPLLPHLLLKDQRAVAVNKNVNETVRKVALRMWRMKTEKKTD